MKMVSSSSSFSLLPFLLRLAWGSMTLLALSSLLLPFVDRLADHGKLLSSSSSSTTTTTSSSSLLSSFLDLTVPKRLFWHFYAWSFLFSLALLGVFYPPVHLPLLLFMGHALRRLYESVYVFQYGEARMHIAAYLVGLAHYTLAGLSFVCQPTTTSSSSSLLTLLGLFLFCVSSYEQARVHAALASLRKSPTSSLHSLPQPHHHWSFGWWVCPHYVFEMLLYLSFYHLLGGRNTTLGWMGGWVVVNLAVSAAKTKRWYVKTYPKEAKVVVERAVLVPGVW